MNWLESGGIMAAIGEFLAEDIGRGDITTQATVDREVRARFHGKSISVQLPEFADGKLIPTCENLARFIFERLADSLRGSATLASVIVREDETISAEFTGED